MKAVIWEYSYKPMLTKRTSAKSNAEAAINIFNLLNLNFTLNNNVNALKKHPV